MGITKTTFSHKYFSTTGIVPLGVSYYGIPNVFSASLVQDRFSLSSYPPVCSAICRQLLIL